jgi:hypothetical protein
MTSSAPLGNAFNLPGFAKFREPKLRFGSSAIEDVDIHPMQGLLQFGPYSKGKLSAIMDPIRIATISPAGQASKASNLLRELQQRHRPVERRNYLPDFPGFSKVFGVQIDLASTGCHIELPSTLSEDIKRADRPHRLLADTIIRALHNLQNVRHDFDVVLVILSKEWESGFYGTEDDDFNLHDYLKAVAASDAICVQFAKESSALNYRCRCSVMWRLGIALYTKAGGIPWVLADIEPGTAFIGIDYALRPGASADPKFAICCSQVFDAEGSGLDFVAYEANDVNMFGKNPFLRREQMMKVMTRSLAIYQKKHSGASPSRIVVHKNTEFKPYEIDGVFDAFSSAQNIELIHVQQNSGWRGIQIEKHKAPHGYPVLRGSALQLGDNATLLWTQGNLPVMTSGKDFFKEGKGIPEPLMLTRYAGLGSMSDLCRETLALTKMDWNNDGPYDRLPVTLNFAGTMASIVKRMPTLQPRSYPVRLFM